MISDVDSSFKDALLKVREEFQKIPDSEELTKKVCTKLQGTFDDPPIEDFEFVCQRAFSLEELRTLVFSPRDEQISAYTELLLVSTSYPAEHRLRKTAGVLLTLIYLIHRKSLAFNQQFIISNGILPLTIMLQYDNLYERSQALEIFLTLTDCDSFDWFQHPENSLTQTLHQRMLGLSNYEAFLHNLIANRSHSYPGGSFRALQLLAFWLSWVRALYTEDQKLILSIDLMKEIHSWTQPNQEKDDFITEEELQLARTLYEDFKTESPVIVERTDTDTAQQQRTFAVIGITSSISGAAPPECFVNDVLNMQRKTVVVSMEERFHRIKEAGNALFKQGLFEKAIDKYNEALSGLRRFAAGNNVNEANKNELEVTARTNIANALWKLYRSQGSEHSRSSSADLNLLQDIEAQCNQVLSLQPNSVKAMYRLLCCMLEKQENQPAFDKASKFIQVVTQAGIKEEDIAMLTKLKRKCIALELLKNQNIPNASFHAESWGLSTEKLSLLEVVLKRYHLSHLVPAQSHAQDCVSGTNASLKQQSRAVKPSSSKAQTVKDRDFIEGMNGIDHLQRNKTSNKKKIVAAKKPVKLNAQDRSLIQQLKAEAKSFSSKVVKRVGNDEINTILSENQADISNSFEVSANCTTFLSRF